MHLSKIDVRGTEQEFSSACGGDLRRGGGGGWNVLQPGRHIIPGYSARYL